MFYSEIKKQIQTYNRRSFIMLLGKVSLFSLIGWKLFDIQIIQSKKYQTLSKRNQINFEILYPLRGDIYDRNNIIIATNKNSYDLFLIPEQTKDIKVTLKNLNKLISIDFSKQRKIIKLSEKVKKFENVKILQNINWEKLEKIEASKNELLGLHLQVIPKRIYPYDNFFSHLLGYTNKPSEKDLKLPFITNMRSLDIGKSGIEKIYNEDLVGFPGKREIEINAFGREIREISRSNSTKGKKIKTSFDLNVQKFAHTQLKDHKAGSIVLIKIKTGEIISMVSKPDFNPNFIIQKPNEEYWKSITNNSYAPLLNRCIQGLYAPGSTFKMIVALAGLKKGLVDINENVLCSGKIEFGNRFYHCWKTKGHGSVNLIKSIKESCDIFFYELSKKVGIDDISKMAKEFGLGENFNIGFEGEKKGIIPDKKWKKKNLKENWYAGETLNAAIGQGYTLSNPLQLAIMTARIASEGKKIIPKILKQKNFENFKQMNINTDHIRLIKEGMFKVVNEQMGTGFKSKSKLFEFSGKTGTSQVRKITLEERESEDFRKKELEWKNKDHALFVGYSFSEKPEYAISVIIEHGGSGAKVAAPIAKKIFDYLYENKIT